MKKKVIVTSFVLSLASIAQNTEKINDIYIVSTLKEKELKDVAASIYLLNKEELREKLVKRSVMESLSETPGVMVQKTGSGMQSPYLRGFTGNQVVMIIDGVKLNNSTFRSGPNEYWNAVNNYFYDNIEVMLGPSSTIYGSDAIGGTIYLSSAKLPRGDKNQNFQFIDGEVNLRAASAEKSISEAIIGTIAFKDKLTLKLGASAQNFGDLKSGKNHKNDHTAYDTWNLNARGTYFFDNDNNFVFGFDNSIVDNIERSHMTVNADPWHGIKPKKDLRRTYDLRRTALYGRYEYRNGKNFINEMDLQLSYQFYQTDFLRQRKLTDYDKKQTKVDTLGTKLRLQTLDDNSIWNYGFEIYSDSVSSWHDRYTNNIASSYDQGPVADDSNYTNYAIYLQNTYQLSENFEWTNGARFTYIHMDANKVNLDQNDRDGKVQSTKDNWKNISMSSQLLYHANDNLTIYGSIAQGFRAPNLADLTSTGDFGGGNLAPVAKLDPETFINYEMGLRYNSIYGNFSAAVFYTQMRNIISRPQRPSPTAKNLDNGYIYGFDASANFYLNHSWTLFGNITYSLGKEDNFINQDITAGTYDTYISRTTPLKGKIGIRFEPNEKIWFECYSLMSCAQNHLAPRDLNDNRIPPNGTPGYATLNLRTGYKFSPNTSLTTSLENILDKDYRIHGSGINEPGINLVLALRHKF